MDDNINKELLLDILGTLTKLRKEFPYTLLFYILDTSHIMKFLDVFAGTTVTFPTHQELMECVTFSIIQKYGGWEHAPKEVLSGISKKRYNELLRTINSCD